MVQGQFFSSMSFHRIVVTQTERDKELRTDKKFRERYQPEHHLQRSPLEDLPIDMVKQIPVSDSLHLIDLGIMKRFELDQKYISVNSRNFIVTFVCFQFFLGCYLDGWENSNRFQGFGLSLKLMLFLKKCFTIIKHVQ